MFDFPLLTLSECIEALLGIQKPLVLMHVRPDGDTVGTAGALLEIFQELGKEPYYASADEIPERLAFLLDGFERAADFSGLTPVAVDVPSPMQLGSLYGALSPVLTIDHHEVSTPFSPNYTLPSASSAGEVLYGVARELERLGKIKITKRIAERIFGAIASDTGGFLYANTTEKTFSVCRELVLVGIDHADISRRLFFSKTKETILAEGFVGQNLKTGGGGKIAYALISKADRELLGLDFSDFETAIDIVRSLLGAEISFVVKETDEGLFKASLRSTGANVAKVASLHSGGGHIRAAGCTVDAKTVDEAGEILLSALKKLL